MFKNIKMQRIMILTLILWGALSCVNIAADLIRVFGYEGRDVKIYCSYSLGYESSEKYFCKNDCHNRDILVSTWENNKNKYFIHDDKTKKVFTVTISDLHFNDVGKYWCAVSRWQKDIYTEVKLEVMPDRCCNSVKKIHSIERGSVSISCQYAVGFVSNLKYICRGQQPSTCLQQAIITSTDRQKGRFRLTDDRKSRIFTVNISNLTLNDSGSYLCGILRNSVPDVFSAIVLELKENQHQTTTAETTTLTTSSVFEKLLQGGALYPIVALPPVLLLILIIILVKVCKNKFFRVKKIEAVTNRHKPEAWDPQQDIFFYENYDALDMHSQQRIHKQHGTSDHLDDRDGNEAEYDSVITTELAIYCNQPPPLSPQEMKIVD